MKPVIRSDGNHIIVAGTMKIADKTVAATAVNMHTIKIPKLWTTLKIIKFDIFNGADIAVTLKFDFFSFGY